MESSLWGLWFLTKGEQRVRVPDVKHCFPSSVHRFIVKKRFILRQNWNSWDQNEAIVEFLENHLWSALWTAKSSRERPANASAVSAQVLFPTGWMRFRDIALRSWLVHSTTVCSWKHRGSKDSHLSPLDSRNTRFVSDQSLCCDGPDVIFNVLSTFTCDSRWSHYPGMLLEVDLIKVWPLEHQAFLLFALLWVGNQSLSQLLSCPVSIRWVRLFFSSGSLFQSCCSLKETKVFQMHYTYLKCDNPVINIKVTYFLVKRTFFLEVLSTILFYFHLPEK